MRIKTVSSDRIDIYLSNDEIEDIFGGYELIDYDTPECRIRIHSLLAAAMPGRILPLDCERILIEVRPQNPGCRISLTKLYSENTKAASRKPEKTVSMVFENSDNLLLALEALSLTHSTASELYSFGDKYAVIAQIDDENCRRLLHISEYCKVSLNNSDTVKIREYWSLVCKTNAIKKLCGAFLK